jgi:hypothetical protein
VLLVTVRRFRCTGCGHVWRQDISKAAQPRAKLSRRGLRWALEGIVCQHLSVARVAEGLGVSWNTANTAVLAEGKRVLIEDPGRFDGVKVIGVDEHVWRHTRRGDKYVTVIIDLTPIRQGTGSSRLLDMVEGRSKQAFKQLLAEREDSWRDGVEVVAMDGFTGFKTATTEELPDAVAVRKFSAHVESGSGSSIGPTPMPILHASSLVSAMPDVTTAAPKGTSLWISSPGRPLVRQEMLQSEERVQRQRQTWYLMYFSLDSKDDAAVRADVTKVVTPGSGSSRRGDFSSGRRGGVRRLR